MSAAKVCIVSMENLKRVPYVSHYAACLDQPFDFVYWDRDGTDDEVGAARNLIYRHRVHHGAGAASLAAEKLTGYIGFRRFARRALREGDYKRVVCLTGNCAVLVGDVLLDKYPGRFVFDIRDYWHEDNRWYHEREQALIESSAFTVISSPAYRDFLGDHDFRVLHNSQILSEADIASVVHEPRAPYKIVCVGAAKNLDYDKRVIETFANDERFVVAFRGRGYDALAPWIAERGIRNAEATGEFDFSRTLEQYRDADAVLSMYGNGSPYWDYALSNKLYFAAQLGLPILVCERTAMADMAEGYDLGVAFEPGDPTACDRVATLFEAGSTRLRAAGRSRFLDMVRKDNERSLADICEFFNY